MNEVHMSTYSKEVLNEIDRIIIEGDYEHAESLLANFIQESKITGEFQALIVGNLHLMKILYNLKRFEEIYPVMEEIEPYFKRYATPKMLLLYRITAAVSYHAMGIGDPILDLRNLLREASRMKDIEQVLNITNHLLLMYLECGDIKAGIQLSQKIEPQLSYQQFTDSMLPYLFYMNSCQLYASSDQFDKVAAMIEIVEAMGCKFKGYAHLEYLFWFNKALVEFNTGHIEQARIHFDKAFQMVDNKYHFLMELDLWIKNLGKYGYTVDVVYYQSVMIEALQNYVKVEQRTKRAKIIERMTKATLSERIYLDSLTKVKNRSFYEEELTKEQEYTNYTMAIFDIDYFKIINDTYGHMIGDQAIQFIATLTSKSLSKHAGEIIRYGGDEFILLLPYKIDEIYPMLEKLHETIANKQFILRETGQVIQLAISMGISYTAGNPQKLEQLFKVADKALYRAKKKGRNRVCLQNDTDIASILLYNH